ncbi:hypothetical protein C7B82_24910 [Stenomitos frigidus ULC18]|uniref:Uncharacterized protein n=1 Tax=Stenomitos frigidus ULC18 TaxID=2107698 RepID=A0A2T1DWW8_9CYAN|nr:hypothetical protein C7B82_24910 [Stenomitos frigidus ULC18]
MDLTILTEIGLRTLLLLAHQASETQRSDFCVSQTMIALAKLGRFFARKDDVEPGPTVLW